jgi:S1-C subfamily serine protease
MAQLHERTELGFEGGESRCPRCGQEVKSSYSVCPACGSSLLVEVWTREPLEDPRRRYEVARALSATELKGVPFAQVQRALEQPAPMAQRLTREVGQRLVAALAAHSVPSMLRVVAPEPPADPLAPAFSSRASRTWLRLLFLGLVGGLSIGALQYAMRQLDRVASEPHLAPTAVRPAPEATSDTLDRIVGSTVAIRCPRSTGAGFFVTEQLVLTNAHVVCEGDEPMRVRLPDGRSLIGVTLRQDARLDLALVDVVAASGIPLPLGDAGRLRSGEKVAMVGSPRGMEFTVTRGDVSYVGRNRFGVAYVQIDTNVNPGNSGGPVVNAAGEVVGVMSMMVKDSNGLGLALPINYVNEGTSPIWSPPGAAPASVEWKALLAQVALADRREVEEASRSFQRPGLLSALSDDSGTIYAVVLQRFTEAPSPRRISFLLEQKGQEPQKCSARTPSTWEKVDPERGARSLDQQMVLWLERHHLNQDLHYGSIRVEGCAIKPGESSELVLEDADPIGERTPVLAGQVVR